MENWPEPVTGSCCVMQSWTGDWIPAFAGKTLWITLPKSSADVPLV